MKDAFNDFHFLADVDRRLHSLKNNDVDKDKLNEVDALTPRYRKKMKKQREDPALRKFNGFLRIAGIKVVPFDKGAGFCLMTNADYASKFEEVLNCPQFPHYSSPTTNKDIAISVEDEFNRRIKRLSDEDKITSSVYSALRSIGAQSARLYGLAKKHKNGIPLRLVLSLPGCCYDKFNKWLPTCSRM